MRFGHHIYDDTEARQKRTIIILIAIISFCVVCIGGLTWALFASGSEDGTIGVNVTTGKVKVDIVDDEDNSLVGDILDFITTDTSDSLYFLPGATYYTQGFRVKNTGNIPMNFRVYVSEDESVDKEEFEEAFELYITTDPENLETAEKLLSFTGALGVEETSGTYYLVVKMKETAGNEFQGKTYTGIGVTVYAVQGNVSVEE